jgi:hypothetical protein
MTGQTKSGKSVTKETSAHIVRWTPTKSKKMALDTVLFSMNQKQSLFIKIFNRYCSAKDPNGWNRYYSWSC